MAVSKRGKRWAVTVYDPARKAKRWVGTRATRGEAKTLEREELARATKRRRLTVERFAETWLEQYPRQRESTNLAYADVIGRFARHFHGRPLGSIDRPEARAYALEHRDVAKVARAMYSDALRDQLCSDNPFADLRLQRSRGRRDLVVPTPDEVSQLADLAGHVHGAYGQRVYRNLILTAAYTGLRPGELWGLEWDDLDFARETLRVVRQYNAKVGKTTVPKNGRSRVIYLSPPAAEALKATPRFAEHVFTTVRGRRFSQRVSHYYWHPLRCAFGRPDLDFYALRHFFGTHLANLGVGAPEIALMMGHMDGGQLAMERYIHVTEQDARAKVGALFGKPATPLHVISGASSGAEGA